MCAFHVGWLLATCAFVIKASHDTVLHQLHADDQCNEADNACSLQLTQLRAAHANSRKLQRNVPDGFIAGTEHDEADLTDEYMRNVMLDFAVDNPTDVKSWRDSNHEVIHMTDEDVSEFATKHRDILHQLDAKRVTCIGGSQAAVLCGVLANIMNRLQKKDNSTWNFQKPIYIWSLSVYYEKYSPSSRLARIEADGLHKKRRNVDAGKFDLVVLNIGTWDCATFCNPERMKKNNKTYFGPPHPITDFPAAFETEVSKLSATHQLLVVLGMSKLWDHGFFGHAHGDYVRRNFEFVRDPMEEAVHRHPGVGYVDLWSRSSSPEGKRQCIDGLHYSPKIVSTEWDDIFEFARGKL